LRTVISSRCHIQRNARARCAGQARLWLGNPWPYVTLDPAAPIRTGCRLVQSASRTGESSASAAGAWPTSVASRISDGTRPCDAIQACAPPLSCLAQGRGFPPVKPNYLACGRVDLRGVSPSLSLCAASNTCVSALLARPSRLSREGFFLSSSVEWRLSGLFSVCRAQPDRVSTRPEIFGSQLVSPPRVLSSPRPENYSARRPVVSPRFVPYRAPIDIYEEFSSDPHSTGRRSQLSLKSIFS
jgi:hypothetical protein